MVLFERVRFKNFGSFGNYFTDIEFKDHKMTLVTGANGHGKSYALLDSITFGLFGKPFRKINIPQLVNSINGKQCIVEVYFSIGTTSYKVVRGLNPKKFEIYKNGEMLSQSSRAKDYQNILEEQIIKMNYKSFTQIVTLGSSSFIPFMQLTAADRREVIEDILNINIFSSMNTSIKAKNSIIKDIILDKNKKVELLKEKIEIQNENIGNLKQRKNKNISENNKKIEITQEQIEILNKEIKLIEKELESLDNLKFKKEKSNEKINKIKAVINQIKNKYTSVIKDITFFDANETCPVCSQDLDLFFKKEKQDLLQEKKNELEEAIQKLNQNKEELDMDLSGINSKIEDISDILFKVNEKKNF